MPYRIGYPEGAESKLSMSAYALIKSFVKFWNCDSVLDLHAKVAASQLAEEALL